MFSFVSFVKFLCDSLVKGFTTSTLGKQKYFKAGFDGVNIFFMDRELLPLSLEPVKEVYVRYIMLGIFDITHLHSATMYGDKWDSCPCNRRAPYIAALVRLYMSFLEIPAPVSDSGTIYMPIVPSTEHEWEILRQVMNDAIESVYPLESVVFKEGDGSAIPEWFRKWCDENDIGIQVLSPEAFEAKYGDAKKCIKSDETLGVFNPDNENLKEAWDDLHAAMTSGKKVSNEDLIALNKPFYDALTEDEKRKLESCPDPTIEMDGFVIDKESPADETEGGKLVSGLKFSGMCPGCDLVGDKVPMVLNSDDFWECPSCNIQGHSFIKGALSLMRTSGRGKVRPETKACEHISESTLTYCETDEPLPVSIQGFNNEEELKSFLKENGIFSDLF